MTVNLELGNRQNSDKLYTLYFRVTHKRKSKRMDSGFRVQKRHWKQKAGQKRFYLASNYPKFHLVEKEKRKLQRELEDIFEKNPLITLDALIRQHHGLKRDHQSVSSKEIGYFGYGIQHVIRLRNEGKIGYSKTMLGAIRDFADFTLSVNLTPTQLLEGKLESDIAFQSINIKLLNDFEHALKIKGLAVNTIHTKFKDLKTIYGKAEKEELFPVIPNPFRKIAIKRAKTKKRALELDDIKKLERCVLECDLLDEARDMFLFSFYCAGLRWGDVCTLKWKNIFNNVLHFIPRKTRETNTADKSIELNQKAFRILSKYKNEKGNKEAYIFSIVDAKDETILFNQISSRNALINKRLKQVAKISGVLTPISFHMSRHSYASLALRKSIPLAEISQLLGHADLKTTQVYLKELDNERIFKAHASILDY